MGAGVTDRLSTGSLLSPSTTATAYTLPLATPFYKETHGTQRHTQNVVCHSNVHNEEGREQEEGEKDKSNLNREIIG